MKMRSIAYAILVGLVMISITSCTKEKKRSKKDLEHAIMMLQDRHDAESRIVEEQTVIRAQLEENYKAANSEGMRNKIQKEIRMINLSIEKAEKNMANQDTIIFQLQYKLDSINQL